MGSASSVNTVWKTNPLLLILYMSAVEEAYPVAASAPLHGDEKPVAVAQKLSNMAPQNLLMDQVSTSWAPVSFHPSPNWSADFGFELKLF